MNLVGLSAGYHDAACCSLVDGVRVAAVEEERFTRVKHDARMPVAAFRHCLAAAGLDISDLNAIAFFETPSCKRGRHAEAIERLLIDAARLFGEVFSVRVSAAAG